MEYGSLMLLYEDNSVEVHCADGSRLLLSPCGSEFLFEKAVPASAHSLQPPERVHQRTPFAISIYRVATWERSFSRWNFRIEKGALWDSKAGLWGQSDSRKIVGLPISIFLMSDWLHRPDKKVVLWQDFTTQNVLQRKYCLMVYNSNHKLLELRVLKNVSIYASLHLKKNVVRVMEA